MISSCLISLLIGVFIACRPTTSRPLVQDLRSLNQEIQDTLDHIIDQAPEAQNLNRTTFRIPVLTEKEQCAMLRLKAFIKLLDPVKIEDEKEFNQLYNSLQDFDTLWSLQETKSVQKCRTEEYRCHDFTEVLKDLRRLMKELYLYTRKV